ncbi:MAG TPA: LysR family transcriptional regulator [Verrucomicrobiae bacterium]|jgi:DNA-binding transcriptional LysR family regulator
MKEISQTVNPLDSRQVYAFVTLVETGSFAKTARHLSLTQSAISHSIRALESEIGCRLLVKMGKTVTATEAGEALFHHAQRGLMEFAAARDKLEKLKLWGTRRLRVGASSIINRKLLPDVLMELRRKYPRLIVAVKTVHSSRHAEQLQSGELDCVISEQHTQDPDLEFTPLFESLFQIIVPANHRWSDSQRLPIEELSGEPFILPEKLSPVRKLIDRYYWKEKRTLNGILEVENLETMREMVKAGLGISILPGWIVQDELRLGTLRSFAPGRRPLNLEWGFHNIRSRPPDLIQCDFRALCVTTVKEIFGTAN